MVHLNTLPKYPSLPNNIDLSFIMLTWPSIKLFYFVVDLNMNKTKGRHKYIIDYESKKFTIFPQHIT
jgi:hypothetical protein